MVYIPDSENTNFVRRFFRAIHARAREIQAETHADEIINIADHEEDISRAKVMIDARKWTASKLKPKKYGSFQQVEHIGDPTMHVTLTEQDYKHHSAKLESEY